MPPKFVCEAPQAPEWLEGEALAEWERIVPCLEELDLLKPADMAVLAVYCVTWARFVDAVAEYKRHGLTLVNPDSGRVGKNPAVAIAEVAASQLRVYASEFGLTPASERNLGIPPKASGIDDSPFAWHPTQ